MDAIIEGKIDSLKDYFAGRPEVSMAFIFGSYVNDRQTSESDVDIAVYFKPKTAALEWEEAGEWGSEDEIWSDVERIVGIKIDLVVLNRAPAGLTYSVLQNGRVLVVKDESLRLRLFLAVS